MSGFFGDLKRKMSRKNTNETGNSMSNRGRVNSAQDAEPAYPGKTTSPQTRRPNIQANVPVAANDAPPAYTPAPAPSQNLTVPGQARTASPAPSTISTKDDPYAFLRSFDTVFLIDDSGSMAGRSWRETAAALETITPVCTAYDADGIDIYFLNAKDSSYYHNVKDQSTVREIFSSVRPSGGTPTGQRLQKILRPYLQQYAANPESTKPLNIIVITDGEPSDDVESPIIAAAKKLDKLDAPAWQVGIQFFQVGREPGARAHLKQLDDELAEISGDDELRDMVDTVPFLGDDDAQLTGDGILKVVLGAVNRRLDRKRSGELHRRK